MTDSGISKKEEFLFKILRHEDTGEFWHEQLEIVFVLRGSGRLFFEKSEQMYVIREGDIFVVNAFQVRGLELDADALAIALLLSPSFMASMSPETMNVYFNCKSFLYPAEKQQKFDIIRGDFARAFRVQYKNDTGHSVYLRSKITILLEDLLRHFTDKDDNTGYEAGRERLRSAIEYIHCNYKKNITLTDMAKHTFLSTTYISHSFQKFFNVSFTGYIMKTRLFHATVMLHGNETITNIAYECGFPNVNAMIKAFKKMMGMTPGEYRKRYHEFQEDKKTYGKVTDAGYSDVFESLMKYVGDWQEETQSHEAVREVQINLKGSRHRIPMHWKRMINAGYASDLLGSNIQQELRQVQSAIGFEYIRCKGILDDDMCLLRLDMNGNRVLNFTCLDEVVDFILSVGGKPMLELGHMPKLLAAKPVNMAMRASIISVPEDINEWIHLIRLVMEHFIERYGKGKVRQWLFAPWLQPDYVEILPEFSLDDYADTYIQSYNAIKSVSKDILICGPGMISHHRYFTWYIEMCQKNHCMPDVITFRSFSSVVPDEEKDGLKLIGNNESFYMAVSGDENCLKYQIEEIRRILSDHGLNDMPLILEEWSNNVWQRDLCNDTCYKSAYIFKMILENNSLLSGMAYFSLNDRLNEIPPVPEIFHGGFGLFTKNGLPKCAYRAYELLAQMGHKCLQKGDGYFISESYDEIQIFLYNYCHYDLLYRYRHTVNMTKTDRYKVFNSKSPYMFNIQFQHADPGKYAIMRYSIGPSGGSIYDAWVKIGAPDPMSAEEQEILMRMSYPEYKVEQIEVSEADNILTVRSHVVPHEVQLIKIRKI